MAIPITQWQGKRVWIIGASFGIGRALAENLAKQGAHLILSGRTEKALETLKATVTGKGHRVATLDVGSQESLSKSFNDFAQEKLDIDCIIYCAGTYQPGPFSEGSLLDFDQTLDINFMGAVRLLHVVESHYSKDKLGQLVFVGSVAGYSGLPNSNIYGPSKAALLNFCEGMKVELESKGIDIRIISPGFVETRMTAKNQFPMPFIVSPEKAATYIIEGLATSSFQIDFPKKMSLFLRFLRLLPYPLYFWFVRKVL